MTSRAVSAPVLIVGRGAMEGHFTDHRMKFG